MTVRISTFIHVCICCCVLPFASHISNHYTYLLPYGVVFSCIIVMMISIPVIIIIIIFIVTIGILLLVVTIVPIINSDDISIGNATSITSSTLRQRRQSRRLPTPTPPTDPLSILPFIFNETDK